MSKPESPPEQQGSDNNVSPTLSQTFQEVAALIRDTPLTPALQTSTTATKLCMYGLYKHAVSGPCSGTETPSAMWPQAYAKYQAYKSYQHLNQNQAMREYVQLAASQDNWLGRKCRELQSEYEKGVDTSNETVDDVPCAADDVSHSPDGSTATDSAATGFWGFRPLIPRGRLDISFADLAFAAGSCCNLSASMRRYQAYDEKITQQWKTATGRPSVVGLSVRSLLDLYLMVKQYPAGSQVIVTPPINVPGMMQVLAYHKLKVVGVDLPVSSDDGSAVVAVDCDAIEKAVTAKTVAILVVHPFGMVSATDGDMQRIRNFANDNNLDVLEDCAECFMGLGPECHVGSPHADISFFSFGLIKTATALGGGVAVVRDEQLVQSMTRLHFSLFRQQTTLEYLFTVVKSLILHWIADSVILYTLIARLVAFLGWDFDAVVTPLLRSFYPKGSSDTEAANRLRWHFRRRPSPALLSVLHRRLCQSVVRVDSVTRRVDQCHRMARVLQNEAPGVNVPGFPPDAPATFWLYPIVSSRPNDTCRRLCAAGFDVTQGASQLGCVAPPDACPRAAQFMRNVCYLPIVGRDVSEIDMLRLARTLRLELDEHRPLVVSTCSRATGVHRVYGLALLPVLVLAMFRVGSGLQFLSVATTAAIMVGLAVAVTSYLLRLSIAAFYINCSSGFATYSGLLLRREQRSQTLVTDLVLRGILESMPVLHVPSRSIRTSVEDSSAVILTGATGFIGSMLLRDLLLHRRALGVNCVILLCRSKRDVSAKKRIEKLLAGAPFDVISAEEKLSAVQVVEGDVTQSNAGLSDSKISHLRERYTISHVIHCAASVSFTQSLPDAAQANISSSLSLQRLTTVLGGATAKFIHLSTAFVHGGLSGRESHPLPEELHPLGSYDPAEVYKSMLGTQFYASKAMNDLRFPNSYTFSKCICEHLLSRSVVDTVIIRPSIVGPAVKNPFEGWAGEKPSTLVAAACLYLKYQFNIWSFGSHRVPCVPVDVLSRFVIAKAFGGDPVAADHSNDSSLSEDDFEKISKKSSSSSEGGESDSSVASPSNHCRRIYTAAWDSTSDHSSTFTWTDYAVTLTQAGAILGYFSRPTAYFGLLVSTQLLPKLQLSVAAFERLHCWLVRRPFCALLQICRRLGIDVSGVTKLLPFLDLPVLFFPFMNNSYYFHSELVPPPEFVGERYVFNCVAAAHHFMAKARQSGGSKAATAIVDRAANQDVSMLRIGGSTHRLGSLDSWWAWTQPKGSLFFRLAGWLLQKLFRATCREVTVDAVSFTSALTELRKVQGSSSLVLAPTHRSLFDFLILSFICFSVPELQVDLPSIAAAEDFERLPIIGWLASCMGAFFVRRGRGQSDPELTAAIRSAERSFKGNVPVIEIFVEGTRSRDRRFRAGKTGVLKCLVGGGRTCVIVPITISYERLPEQGIMTNEAGGGVRGDLNTTGMLSWLKSVIHGKVNLGCVHVSAGAPITVGTETVDHSKLVDTIQRSQQEQLYVSAYHIAAASRLLRLDQVTVKTALGHLRCRFWPHDCSSDLAIPTDPSELCCTMLQCSPWLAALFYGTRPSWSKWLNRTGSLGTASDSAMQESSVIALEQSLGALFDNADQYCQNALDQLRAKGFGEPSKPHVLQVARTLGTGVPTALLHASIDMHWPRSSKTGLGEEAPLDMTIPQWTAKRLDDSGEALGLWGFHDSAFVVRMNKKGLPVVTMQGDRYGLCGKQMTRLLPFIERETQIRVDPLNEAFQQADIRQVASPCRLGTDAIELLGTAASRVSISEEDRVRHGTGHSLEDVFTIRSGRPVRVPDAVVWPASEEEVEIILRLAKTQQWCLVPFGGGTNVSQATTCPSLDVEPRPIVSVDMKSMSNIRWVNEEDGLACVEAGITGRELVDKMAERGFTIGHEPDSIEFSTLGGWIATKASGMKRNRYGNIEDIVKGVRVAGPNGVLQHGLGERSAWGRESCGLDLSSLILGSEGCLGIITTAVIRIWPLPQVKDYDSVLLSNFDHGLRFVRDVSLLDRKAPASCRLLDNEHFRLGQALGPDSDSWLEELQKSSMKMLLHWNGSFDAKCVVCVTMSYEGSKEEVSEQKRAMARLCSIHGGIRLGARVGKAGYDMTFMIAYLRDFAMTYHFLGESFETFAPWSKVEGIVRATKERIVKEHADRCLPGLPFVGCRVTQLYHEGVCLYFYLCMNFENVDNPSHVFSQLEHAARSEILEQGGSLSHHHGIGKVRASFLDKIQSTALQEAMKSIKNGMDPENIFGARNGAFAE